MHRLLLCSIAFGLLTFAVHTDNAPLLSGVGQLTCDQVASDSQPPGIPGELAKNAYIAWAQGDLTALHVMQSQKQTPITNYHPPGFGVDEQWTEMVAWCQGHPGKIYVNVLVGHLDDVSR